jgi:hypothetical protein
MTPITKGGVEFDPTAVELLERKAQGDLAAPVSGSGAVDGDSTWGLDGFQPAGHWRRYLRDTHPPRFPAPGGVEVTLVAASGPAGSASTTDASTEAFGATAAFGIGLPAQTEAAFATLPGKPGWRCYVTSAGRAPAAVATFTDGSIVLLAVDATAATGRRSPARSALLHRVISDAIEAGTRLLAARIDERAEEASEAVAGLLLAGFEKSYLCPAWVDAGLPAS